jgi:hypothetical protein
MAVEDARRATRSGGLARVRPRWSGDIGAINDAPAIRSEWISAHRLGVDRGSWTRGRHDRVGDHSAGTRRLVSRSPASPVTLIVDGLATHAAAGGSIAPRTWIGSLSKSTDLPDGCGSARSAGGVRRGGKFTTAKTAGDGGRQIGHGDRIPVNAAHLCATDPPPPGSSSHASTAPCFLCFNGVSNVVESLRATALKI